MPAARSFTVIQARGISFLSLFAFSLTSLDAVQEVGICAGANGLHDIIQGIYPTLSTQEAKYEYLLEMFREYWYGSCTFMFWMVGVSSRFRILAACADGWP